MDSREWSPSIVAVLVVVAALAVAFAVTQALVAAYRTWSRRRKILARVTRAGEGEQRAAAWLTDLGYEILGAQVATDYPVRVDDTTVTIGVRADYLVEKGGSRYVVEVKTGNVAPRIETPATRRQLLEYRIAFDVEGVLLVDAEAGLVRAVTFPNLGMVPERHEKRSWGLVFLAVAVCTALAVRAWGMDDQRLPWNTSRASSAGSARP